jgi:demethylmenaquinone methyltransferase/2-methoxy-6-polyprenyl-1,4-benzoquinol methylase
MRTDILKEQIQSYRDRASEYDEWFFRQGRYDRGEEHRQQWFKEIGEVETALRAIAPTGNILELACGTDLWTQHLAPLATGLTAIDVSEEAIAPNWQRVAAVLNPKGRVFFVDSSFTQASTTKDHVALHHQ